MKNKKIILIIIMINLALYSFAQNQDKTGQQSPETYLNNGKRLVKAKNYAAAIPDFERSARLAEQSGNTRIADSSRSYLAAIYTVLGNDDLKNGVYNTAIEKYNKALNYQPGFYKAYYGLGLVYREQGNLQPMKAAFDEVIAKGGGDTKTIGNAKDAATAGFQKAGAIALMTGKYGEAVQYLQISLQYNNTEPRTFLYLAVAFNALSKWDDAIAEANKALQLQTGDKSDIFFELGKSYEKKGNAGTACMYFKKVITGENVAAAKNQVEKVLKCQ